MEKIEVLPFNHNLDNFWQAVNIIDKDLFEALVDFEKFNSFDLSKKLRVLSITILVTIKAIIRSLNDGRNALPVLFILVCDFDKKESEIIELIEKNLIKYLKMTGESLEQFEKDLNKLFSSINNLHFSVYTLKDS